MIPQPAYNVQLGALGLAGVGAYFGNYVLAGAFGILGVFLTIQTNRVKFCFKDKSLVSSSCSI